MIVFRFCFLLLILLPFSAQAELSLSGSLTQGGLLLGQVPAGSRVYFGEQALKLSADGFFILGFGRDAKPRQSLTWITPAGKVETRDLQIVQRQYQIERIDGISQKMMAPDEKAMQQIRRDAAQASAARRHDSDLPFFNDTFIWPVKGRISGVYGSQRIFNDEPRRPHFGVDIAAPTGTAVIAPAGGKVTLAHSGMFFSGKTLIIDHGHGLSSSFLHLDTILVKENQRVAQGEKIATVGATGRVTGPHLDWRINWFDVRLDPVLLVPEMATDQPTKKN